MPQRRMRVPWISSVSPSMTIACPITSSEKALPIHANMNNAAILICRIAPSLQCAGLNSHFVSHDLARQYHVSKKPAGTAAQCLGRKREAETRNSDWKGYGKVEKSSKGRGSSKTP